MKSHPQSTDSSATKPSASTGGAASSTGRLGVHWVYPSARVDVFADKQCFGRDPACDVVLFGTEVSRRHMEVSATGTLPQVRDLGSRNGVLVGGCRVRQHLLGPGDVLRVGEWIGIVREFAQDHAQVAQLSEIAPGWFGGQSLVTSVDPLRRVAATDLPVVIQGETGTGKEGAARALHGWSGRPGQFVAVDCGALPEPIAEALLFGYRKGAFTGADQASEGHLRAAHGGTLFLDEILNLSLGMQAKLLRALERREVLPLGESSAIPIDVRVVCAAQEPLCEAVTDKRFRPDLMARLDGVTVVLPPLRERIEDVMPLFLRFLEQSGGSPRCEPKFVESLLLYDWPLNVRELLLLARRLLAMHPGALLKRSLLPTHMRAVSRSEAPSFKQINAERRSTDDKAAFTALVDALTTHAGNLTTAAAALGLTRARAYRLLGAHPEFDIDSLRKGVAP